MNRTRPLIAFVLLALGAACSSTPYQRLDNRGGYTNTLVSARTHLITVRVNEYTDPALAYVHFERRARELCGPHYEVLEATAADRKGLPARADEKPQMVARVRCTAPTAAKRVERPVPMKRPTPRSR